MRPVKARVFDRVSRTSTEVRGKFHQWGTTFEEFEMTAIQTTVAIIEDKYGKVHTCPPENVEFLDSFPEDEAERAKSIIYHIQKSMTRDHIPHALDDTRHVLNICQDDLNILIPYLERHQPESIAIERSSGVLYNIKHIFGMRVQITNRSGVSITRDTL